MTLATNDGGSESPRVPGRSHWGSSLYGLPLTASSVRNAEWAPPMSSQVALGEGVPPQPVLPAC
eukprot:5128648-Karenia_brevis.AAC.1